MGIKLRKKKADRLSTRERNVSHKQKAIESDIRTIDYHTSGNPVDRANSGEYNRQEYDNARKVRETAEVDRAKLVKKKKRVSKRLAKIRKKSSKLQTKREKKGDVGI